MPEKVVIRAYQLPRHVILKCKQEGAEFKDQEYRDMSQNTRHEEDLDKRGITTDKSTTENMA